MLSLLDVIVMEGELGMALRCFQWENAFERFIHAMFFANKSVRFLNDTFKNLTVSCMVDNGT